MNYQEKYYYVYILASKKNGTLYTGVTNDLIRRAIEHRIKLKKGFPEKYNVKKLVHFETFKYISDAIEREKKIKKWNRAWKIHLIEKENKEWRDLMFDYVTEDDIESAATMLKENDTNL
ncbi:MAG TPA: GIY-YIG nuclease family protein [Ignavibacteria bacterium]